MKATSSRFWLTTDLDGTLIPIDNTREAHGAALQRLGSAASERPDREIVFVTGRHLESVLQVLQKESLPTPHSIITDVGSRIWNRVGQQWESDAPYDAQLSALCGGVSMEQLGDALSDVPGLQLQSPERQGLHKLSFECKALRLEQCVSAVNERIQQREFSFSVTASVDPFSNLGLIDVLPKGVSKRFAIEWFHSNHHNLNSDQLMFCGDSGNDLEVFLSPIRSVVVGNTSETVKQQVMDSIREGNTPEDSVYFAIGESTSGVLEGARHFGWLE
ncbi:MAG: HAD-IIB family hydrolase [Puniceicoccaceae bacterium]